MSVVNLCLIHTNAPLMKIGRLVYLAALKIPRAVRILVLVMFTQFGKLFFLFSNINILLECNIFLIGCEVIYYTMFTEAVDPWELRIILLIWT